ncbi:MAG TPA: hydantoinase/oxoprolinase family protein, partial [Gemmatimonadaceae bacterium]|nr:hydantoinase/oxoprolinase family protein [Gemmatimonadaceae bacterium]
GGSIAWIDAGGALQVGPHSAGVRPGPVAFGRGGTLPTVTDAHVALGRIAEARMSGGVELDVGAARTAVTALADTMGQAAPRVAQAIVATADATMARALRRVSVERGVDPRGCALIAFGGGGPLHACGLADMLGITRVIVPPHAGVLSALGLAMTPERRETMWSVMQRLDAWSGVPRESATVGRWIARMRYVGQGHELDVPVRFARASDDFGAMFTRLHRARYGFALEAPVEVVSVRQVMEGTGRRPRLRREAKPATRRLTGPASLALPDATLFVAKGWTARLLDSGAWNMVRA